MKIIMTGFDPFGGETINPAYEAVKRLPEEIGGAEIIKMELPTVFGTAGRKLTEAVDIYTPAAVIAVGQAGGRDRISLERVAVNLRDARIPDNGGYQPVDEPVLPGAPAAYFATLPVKEIVSAMEQAGIPAAVSNTAGTFVCNDLMYTLLHETAGKEILAGFIHVPYAPQQAEKKGEGTPCMEISEVVRALKIAVETVAGILQN